MTLAAEIAADAPVAWWRLDETVGTAAADSAGVNTGTYTGSPALNQVGLAPSDSPNRAVLFSNSTLQYVEVPHAAALNAASLTVQASFDASSINGNMRMVEKGLSDSGWALKIEGTDLRWYVAGHVTVDYHFTDTGRHVAHGTYDAATGTGQLFLDGALVASTTGTPGSAPTPADPLRIAQKPGGSAAGDGWNGLLDDVAVYAAVLAPARIAAHAAAVGLTGYPTTVSWRGYSWTRAVRVAASPFANAFAADHVAVDGSDNLHLTITNIAGASTGGELACNTPGLGYGTYRCLVERAGGFNAMHPNVVFGGMFTYDGASPAYGHREIDCCEQSAWSGATGPWTLGHVTWMPSSPTDILAARGGYDAADIATMSDAVQTHVMEWRPDRVVFRSYRGDSTSPAALFRESAVVAGQTVTFGVEGGGTYTGRATIPVPGAERVHFNLWVCPNYSGTSDPATVTATEVIIRDFVYTPPALASSTAAALRDLIAAVGLTRAAPGGTAPMPVMTRAPAGLALPYVLVAGLADATVREPGGDFGDQAVMDDGMTELLQVEHIRRLVDGDGTETDDSTADTIAAALTGARLPYAPHRVYGVTADAVTRVPSPDPAIARTAITVRVRRSLRRTA